MENILSNPGLSHVREQIFGHLDPDTLENCYEVCVERFGEDWDFAWWTTFQAKRSALIQYIFEFDIDIPGWNKGVEKFCKKASLNDLIEIKGSIMAILKEKVKSNDHPVQLTIMHDHVKLMELLLFTDFEFYEHGYYAPLIVACQEGSTKIVELIFKISKKFAVDLNTRTPKGRTGFTWACSKGHKEIVHLMVNASKEFSIDLNAANENGITGFMLACHQGHTEIVNLLINASKEFSIDLNAANEEGDTGFTWACTQGHTEMVNMMINASKEFSIDLNAADKNGSTGFMLACEQGHTDLVYLLTNASEEFSIDLNAAYEDGITGLC